MFDNLLTRDDVLLSKPRRFRIPFLLRFQIMNVSVAGQDFEIGTVKTPFSAGAEVRTAHKTVAKLETADTERAIAALLDALNTQASEQN